MLPETHQGYPVGLFVVVEIRNQESLPVALARNVAVIRYRRRSTDASVSRVEERRGQSQRYQTEVKRNRFHSMIYLSAQLYMPQANLRTAPGRGKILQLDSPLLRPCPFIWHEP